jgi:hypothetical protein
VTPPPRHPDPRDLIGVHRPHLAVLRAGELLHLPGEPAGVEEKEERLLALAGELLHLPGEPAGVRSPVTLAAAELPRSPLS